MNPILSVRYNLANLLRFGGRESRAVFWPYAAFVFLLSMLAMPAVMIPHFLSFGAQIRDFAASHPDQTTMAQGPGYYSVQINGPTNEFHSALSSDFRTMFFSMAVIVVVVVLLVAAAVVRRLHDRGLSGAWGLMPLPFLGYGLYAMPGLFSMEDIDTSAFFMLFFNNMIYLGTLAALAILLLGPSDGNANRHGPAPDSDA